VAEGEGDEDRVVLGRKDDSTWVGFQWTDAAPEGIAEPDEAEELGAVWEGEELVTYELESLKSKTLDEDYLEDVD
jgi:hypothetical protein